MPWLPLLCFSDVSWEGVGGNSPHEILREEIEQLFIFFFFFFTISLFYSLKYSKYTHSYPLES